MRAKPKLTLPLSLNDAGCIVDATGETVAVTFAPMELDQRGQDRYRNAIAALFVAAVNGSKLQKELEALAGAQT